MARYEPKHVDVTICVDDTLSKGVESWAWYGLQPINRLTVPDGTVLMTSLQPFDALLKDIHKKDAPYKLSLIRAKASFSGLWVYKEDHTEVRILGALAKIAPSFLTLDAVAEAIKEMEWGSELKVASARKAFDRIETREVKITEGNAEVPYAFEMPKWWEMREGVTIPAIPIGKPKEGGQGYVPERNPYFKKFSTRTMRPVIDFDTCVKCNLCWISCPDSVFDVMPDGTFDAAMEACCGCGVCEAVCPVEHCITMVNEAAFEDNASQWEMWRKDKTAYKTVIQAIAKKISGGQLVAEYIVAEGEHSQFEIVKHASTVGARVFCGSSGVGWAYAMECLVVTPPLRVPMVCLVGNRALDDPGAFGVEHNDALVVRDLGWMLCWIDTSQEALDTTLIAYRVAEDRRVFLPLAISADGAFLTHSQAITMVPPKEKVDRYLPRYDRGDLLLHPDNPITVAPQANEDWVIEIRRQNDEAMKRAVGVIEEAYADFRRVFGRGPENPWFEEYMADDAEIILVGMGTISLPIKVAIREMRAKGKKVGLVRLRWFRPFPFERLVKALSGAKAIGVIDRDYSFGSPFHSGVVANEIRASLYNADTRPPLLSFICGLRGREVTLEDVNKAVDVCYAAAKAATADAKTHWLGVRE